MKRVLTDILFNPLYVFLLVTLAYFSLRAANDEVLPPSIQGHWVRISTNCGEPLKQEDLVKIRHSGDARMPVRASLILTDKSFTATLYAGELCNHRETITPTTTMTDKQTLNCDPPQTNEGTITWDSANRTIGLNAEAEELGDLEGSGLATRNTWGRTIYSVEAQQRDGILQLSTEHRSMCPEGQKWYSYWVPFQGV